MPRSLPLAAPWPFRALWLLLPVVAGPAVADALADRSRAVQLVASVMAWAGWGGVLAASLVLRTVTLTVVRALAPGAVLLCTWAAFASDELAWGLAGIVVAVLAAVAALSPATADAFVDGSSYGDERRVALRVPVAMAVGPVPIAWALAAAGLVAGPLLLAAEQWIAGGIALVLGVPIVVAVALRLHLLSRRWLVFVPAGVVVHDPIAMAEPVLLQRHLLRRIGPADADATKDGSLDLTGGALGLALELRTAEPFKVGLRQGRETVETAGVPALLVTPGRPATTLEIAAERKLPVS
ncbi:hypothetical protein NHL50_09165 [Acidimicrobiia bacterium EGI L10123]|uniref:hypothetical protein n=1 Tax=Salinilacustrithrix flava TaxID=2957203 RepID=UPI003D7C1F2C|nr:hypothetical protein [Acidimicrobiia bacterium EGI L10123]